MEPKKSPWPRTIVAFFMVVFVANWILVYLAVSGFDGLVEDNYYEKGLRYNDTIQQEKRLGWKIELSFTDDLKTGDKNKAKVVIFNRNGEPVGGAKVKVVLRRPANDEYDNEIELLPSGCAYHGNISIPEKGLWDIIVKTEKGKDGIEKTFRVRTKDENGSNA